MGMGRDIRQYLHFAIAIRQFTFPLFEFEADTHCLSPVLLILVVGALIVRYKGHSGRLVRVIRRDGGLCYIALAGEPLLIPTLSCSASLRYHQPIFLQRSDWRRPF